jgi:hypothetical protein
MRRDVGMSGYRASHSIDSFTLSDAVSAQLVLNRVMSDTVIFSDDTTGGMGNRIAVDTLTLLDLLEYWGIYSQATQDTLELQEHCHYHGVRGFTPADELAFTENLSVSLQLYLNCTEMLVFADEAGKDPRYLLREDMEFVDTAGTTKISSPAFLDALLLSDDTVATRNSSATATDTLDFTDQAAQTRELTPVSAETLTFTDQTNQTRTQNLVIHDGVSFTDAIQLAVQVTTGDTWTPADTASVIIARPGISLDAVTWTDDSAAWRFVFSNILSTVTFSDTFQVTTIRSLTSSDSVVFSDGFTVVPVHVVAFSDSVTLTDLATSFRRILPAATDAVTLSDGFTVVPIRPRTTSDTLTFSEATTGDIAASSLDFSDPNNSQYSILLLGW